MYARTKFKHKQALEGQRRWVPKRMRYAIVLYYIFFLFVVCVVVVCIHSILNCNISVCHCAYVLSDSHRFIGDMKSDEIVWCFANMVHTHTHLKIHAHTTVISRQVSECFEFACVVLRFNIFDDKKSINTDHIRIYIELCVAFTQPRDTTNNTKRTWNKR